MEKIRTIKLYDNEASEYPIIIIKEESIKEFKNLLKLYQKNEAHNIDGFINILNNFEWFIKIIDYDEMIFF